MRDLANGLIGRMRTVPSWMIDAVVGTVILFSGVLSTGAGGDPSYEDRDAVAWTLILLGTLPYYVRRRAPMVVFVVTGAALAALMLLGYDSGALPLALLVGCYTVAVSRPVRTIVAAAAVLAALEIALYAGDVPGFGVGELVSSSAAYGAAMLLGWSMQVRAQRIEALEHGQVESALRAAAHERLRIAQEIHDIVAHSLGVIAVQAGVGMHVVESDPAEARRALEHISHTSRTSLSEIRQLLTVLRDADGGPAYGPAPGLSDLADLVTEVQAAGLAVDLRVDGDFAAVPAGVGLAAYRIVQEALTNALRHAEARRALVRLQRTDGAVTIEVSDDGRGVAAGRSAPGHGVVGMRERVAVYGGSFTAGAGPGGGFSVRASLPVEARPPAARQRND